MHARTVFEHLDLSRVSRVLDIGCGTGWALRQLAGNHPEVEFHGLDLSRGMIREARTRAEKQRLGNVQFHHADWEVAGPLIARAEHEEVQPGFDLILALSSLHYISNMNMALEYIRESLYAGGKLVLVERATRGSFLTGLWGAIHKHVLKDGVAFIGTGELLSMMRQSGFADVRSLTEKREFLKHGKLFTSIVVAQGTKPDAAA